MAAKKPKKSTKAGKSVKINLVPSDELLPSRLYANYVQVGQSPYDFSLRFCDVTPISDLKKVIKNEGIHEIPVVAEIAIPFDVMPPLIKALQEQYKKYQANK